MPCMVIIKQQARKKLLSLAKPDRVDRQDAVRIIAIEKIGARGGV